MQNVRISILPYTDCGITIPIDDGTITLNINDLLEICAGKSNKLLISHCLMSSDYNK